MSFTGTGWHGSMLRVGVNNVQLCMQYTSLIRMPSALYIHTVYIVCCTYIYIVYTYMQCYSIYCAWLHTLTVGVGGLTGMLMFFILVIHNI